MECRCGHIHDMVVSNRGVTYYPRLGLFRHENRLMHIGDPAGHMGWHFWLAAVFVQPWYRSRTVRVFKAHTADGSFDPSYILSLQLTSYTDRQYGVCLFSRALHNGVLMMGYLLRIQRAVRAFIQARRETRALAVAMALHPRLGKLSGLARLPVELLITACRA